LYVPGNDAYKISNCLKLELDAFCIDLEDGISASRKEQARNVVIETLSSLSFPETEVFVRINSVQSGLMETDLRRILQNVKPNGIIIPKVEERKHVLEVFKVIGAKEIMSFPFTL